MIPAIEASTQGSASRAGSTQLLFDQDPPITQPWNYAKDVHKRDSEPTKDLIKNGLDALNVGVVLLSDHDI